MTSKDNKAQPIRKVLDTLSTFMADRNGQGMARSSALGTQKCAWCGGDATEFKNAMSEREYKLTAWCQKCQDGYFDAPLEQ